MANPSTYQPSYNFSNWQATNPTRPLPAPQVDNELANIARSLDSSVAAITDIRRSDGQLKNGIVGPDALSPTLSLGFSFEGAWQEGQTYQAGDGVVFNQAFYAARVSHIATTANQPGNTTFWTLLFSLEDIVVAGALSLPVDTFFADGVTTDFDLSFTPVSNRNLFITIGGAPQATSEYSVNGNRLSFDVAPPTGPNGENYPIEVRGFATTGNLVVPVDGSVTEDKLDPGLAETIREGAQPDLYATRTLAQSTSLGTVREAILTSGAISPLDGRGRFYAHYASEPTLLEDRFTIPYDGGSPQWYADPFTVDVIVNIPAQFPTIQSAIDALSRAPMRKGQRFVLVIADNHVITAGWKLQWADYGMFVIRRETKNVGISAVTKANPGVITTASVHNLAVGDLVGLYGAGGMTELNGETVLVASVPTSTTFTATYLDGTAFNTTAFTTYTSGGYVVYSVKVSPTFAGVANTDGNWALESVSAQSTKNLMLYQGCDAPQLDCLFDMNSPRDTPGGATVNRFGHGIYINNARMSMTPMSGVARAGMTGISNQNSQVFAIGTVWNGAGSEGISASQAALHSFQSAYANDCQLDCTTSASSAAVYCSRASNFHFQNGKALRSGRFAFDCHRGWLNMQDALLSGSNGRVGNVQDGGHIILDGATVTAIGGSVTYIIVFQDGTWSSMQETLLVGAPTGKALSIIGGGCNINGYGTTYNGAALQVTDIDNLTAFNYPTRRGAFFYDVDGPLELLAVSSAGNYSATGATAGKRFTSATTSILSSSRTATSEQTHYELANTNGVVSKWVTISGGGRLYITPTVWIGFNAGSPEGVQTAGIGSMCTDTTGGKLYVKATGTGNTGWVVAGTQT